jgi:hypothetical protein
MKRFNAGRVDGIGYVFAGDHIGIDLDHAIDESGRLKSWAADIVNACATYTEISPSGTGLHLYSKGTLPEDWSGRKRSYHDGAVEIYSRGRFFTVTGNRFGNSPSICVDQSAYIIELYKKLSAGNGNGNNGNGNGHHQRVVVSDVDGRLEVALRDSVFSRLWYGDTSANNGDDSAADLALCNKLVFYFGPNVDTIDSLFRQSKLYRQKWDRSDYRTATINKAIVGTPDTYTPSKTGHAQSRAAGRNINEPGEEKNNDEQPWPKGLKRHMGSQEEENHQNLLSQIPPGVIVLPNDHFTFPDSAALIFPMLAATGRYFVRGRAIVELQEDSLTLMTPPAFRSRVDRCGIVMAFIKTDSGSLALKRKRCSQDYASGLLETIEARELLPRIRVVTRSAVIVRTPEGGARVLGPGYHPEAGGVLVTGSSVPEQVEAQTAVEKLRQLCRDFDFGSSGDESRAFASVITPALRIGGWLSIAPIDASEANESQAGKTLKHALVRAIYGERGGYHIAKRENGVGSLDESLGTALLSGQAFISFDNFRGRFDSQYFESIVTRIGPVPVRVPHRGEVEVDASAVTYQLSSNGIEMTRDLANRTSVVRIRKRPKNYVFYQWPEGDLISHVEANTSFYLGCVFSVVQKWVAAGQPRLSRGFHDFREWAGVLGWIVENIFQAAPLLDGHEIAQARVSNPALSWLRLICLAAERTQQLGTELSASALAELSENEGIELPGLRSLAADDQARKHCGKLMARCYQAADQPEVVRIDDFEVHRTEYDEYDETHRRTLKVRRYRIVRSVRTVLSEVVNSIENGDFPESYRVSEHSEHSEQGGFEEIPF